MLLCRVNCRLLRFRRDFKGLAGIVSLPTEPIRPQTAGAEGGPDIVRNLTDMDGGAELACRQVPAQSPGPGQDRTNAHDRRPQ